MSTTTQSPATRRAAREIRSPRKPQRLGRAPSDTPAGPMTYAVLTLAVLMFAFPLYWMFVVGTSNEEAVSQSPPRIIPGDQARHNFQEIRALQNVDFFGGLFNSFIASTLVMLSVLFFCSLAGFAFAKLRFPGRNALLFILIGTLMIPNQLGQVAMYVLMLKLPYPGSNGEGWTTHLISVIVPGLVTAFGVFYMRQYIEDSIPDELIEAGRVDGASTFRIFWSVVLPTLRPALAVLGLLTFAATWNDFQWPLITLTNPEIQTVQVALSNLATGQTVPIHRVSAGSVLATLPLLVVFFVAGKQIVSGIMEGAVKS